MMHRRKFLAHATAAAAIAAAPRIAFAGSQRPTRNPVHPFDVGLKVDLAANPEEPIARVASLGFKNIFFSLDAYINKFTPALANQINILLDKYGLTPTATEVVGPGRLAWNFIDGPSTIGVIPPATRAARIDALKQCSDFAKLLNIPQVQTHVGFIPENPRDPLYPQAVAAIKEVALHCAANNQSFLMETGQETPVTMLRLITDVNHPALGVGLDTANLILYGKSAPTEAIDLLGPYIRNTHMKDGRWPTGPTELGEEVIIGSGAVDFTAIVTKLRALNYKGPLTIERETNGPQQIADIKQEKLYLENTVKKVFADLGANSTPWQP